ncbi:MAG TPA: hypothetical protein VHO03_16900 [Ignavibacteriales bacterium]|nr:hypothetical protein [Ignavibacteriales bacterium]
MIANFNVKVYGGVRRKIEVIACPTSVNEKTFTFKNGKQTSDEKIAAWIQSELTKALKTLAEES